AWVSAAVSVTLVLLLLPLHPKLRWRSARATGMVALVCLVVLVALGRPILRRALDSKDDSTVAREIYKADARKMIAAAPWFGHGLNSYVFELPDYTSISRAAYGRSLPVVHEIFYLWWAETGIVGLILWCIVWGSIIWMGFTNLSVKDELLFAVNSACLSAILCLIPDSFLSWTLRVNTMLRMFWVMAGLIAAIRYMRFREHRVTRLRTTNGTALVGTAALEPVSGD
ncbi:MAG: O-antigen ligase family protein, partial [Gemmatimonadaceae bacterium]